MTKHVWRISAAVALLAGLSGLVCFAGSRASAGPEQRVCMLPPTDEEATALRSYAQRSGISKAAGNTNVVCVVSGATFRYYKDGDGYPFFDEMAIATHLAQEMARYVYCSGSPDTGQQYALEHLVAAPSTGIAYYVFSKQGDAWTRQILVSHPLRLRVGQIGYGTASPMPYRDSYAQQPPAQYRQTWTLTNDARGVTSFADARRASSAGPTPTRSGR